jgi:hypothetical protein
MVINIELDEAAQPLLLYGVVSNPLMPVHRHLLSMHALLDHRGDHKRGSRFHDGTGLLRHVVLRHRSFLPRGSGLAARSVFHLQCRHYLSGDLFEHRQLLVASRIVKADFRDTKIEHPSHLVGEDVR